MRFLVEYPGGGGYFPGRGGGFYPGGGGGLDLPKNTNSDKAQYLIHLNKMPHSFIEDFKLYFEF